MPLLCFFFVGRDTIPYIYHIAICKAFQYALTVRATRLSSFAAAPLSSLEFRRIRLVLELFPLTPPFLSCLLCPYVLYHFPVCGLSCWVVFSSVLSLQILYVVFLVVLLRKVSSTFTVG